MIATAIVLLFISQVVSFYFIVLLYTKLSRSKEVEQKQERLMRELDDAVAAYLVEVQDENNRLIKELTKKQISKSEQSHDQQQKSEHTTKKEEESKVQTFQTPKQVVAKAYQQANTSADYEISVPEVKRETFTLEEEVQMLFSKGHTPEQIAKRLQKGKTEIELLLKFRN